MRRVKKNSVIYPDSSMFSLSHEQFEFVNCLDKSGAFSINYQIFYPSSAENHLSGMFGSEYLSSMWDMIAF